MHPVGSPAQPDSRTISVDLDLQQPQSSNTEPPDISIATSRRQESNEPTHHSKYDAIRDDDRRRWAAGEYPGPDWKDEQAMKAWLEQRFPQGTEAGSPYYQFMIASSRFEDTYWLPGRGSKEVVGKFSEREWKRWKKEKAGLVMHSTWGQNPLYPDTYGFGDQAASGYSATSSPCSQPLTQGHDRYPANVNLHHKVENSEKPSRMEGHLDSRQHGLEKSHGSSKRSAERAELHPGGPSVTKRLKRSPHSASVFPKLQSIPEKASSSKKRTASNAEINTDESPTTKRVKRFAGPTSPSRTADLDSSALNSPGDRAIRQSKHGSRSRLPPPENRTEELKHNSQPNLSSLKSYNNQVVQPTSPSTPRALKGQEEEEEDDRNPPNKTPTHPNRTTKPTTPNPSQRQNRPSAPHEPNPQPQLQRTIEIIPPPPSNHLPPPPQTPKQRLTPSKKRRLTSENPPYQTRYTTMHLRSGTGKRRHTLPRKSSHITHLAVTSVAIANSF